VTITVTPVNDPPVATDDAYVAAEDSTLTILASGVLGNDHDVDEDDLTATVATGPSHGALALNADGSFTYTPHANFHGEDTFAYTVSDGALSDTATVTITVTPVNDPPVVTLAPTVRTVQYSDGIAPVTVSVTDIDSASVTVIAADLPLDLSVGPTSCYPAGDGATCVAQITGAAAVAAGTHPYSVNANDGDDDSTPVSGSISVTAESTSVSFDTANLVSQKVDDGKEYASGIALKAIVVETEPDLADGIAAAGDVGKATIAMSLVPVGPGSPITGSCPGSPTGTGYEQVRAMTCTFDPVPVNTYTVEVTVTGGYYAGSSEDVFTVYDPDAGFATGGGWFEWPGTGDRTTFGFTMKYNKKGTSVQDSLLLIRHLPDGSLYRVESNALYGLAVGQTTDASGTYGWASFSGKSTYLEPGWFEPIGNQQFVVAVTDRNEPGIGVDTFQIRMLDQPTLTLGEPVEISGGNIAVPHGGGGGGGRKAK
jgi:VCBS repeat-containing protein